MTPEEKKRLYDLCSRIPEEQDPVAFNRRVMELNELLETKHERIPRAN